MAQPIVPIVLSAKSTTLVSSTEKNYITFKNLTRGGQRTSEVNQTTGEAALENTPSDWVNNDLISVQVYGKYNKATTATISQGGISVRLGTLSEDTSTANISL